MFTDILPKCKEFDKMDKLKILKAVVFTMTFLIIFGLIVLSNRLINKGKAQTNLAESINLSEPEGTQIEAIESSDGRLHLLVKGGNKPDRIIIFDVNNQRKISTITIN